MKIKRLVSLIIMTVFLYGCGASQDMVVPGKKIPTAIQTEPTGIIMALGDSLTEGFGLEKADSYPSQLDVFLREKGYNYQIINSGISGETSTGMNQRIDWVLSQNPDIIILTIGANDAIRGINLDITRENIASIIEKIQAKNIELIFSGMEIYENLGSTYVDQFKAIYPNLAEKYNLPFIPFFLKGVAGDPDLNISDQIHPNREGYTIIIKENVWPVLEPFLEK